MLSDFKLSLRGLAKAPGVADVSRIVALETRPPAGELIDTSYPDFPDYRAEAKSFADLLVYQERPLNLGAPAGRSARGRLRTRCAALRRERVRARAARGVAMNRKSRIQNRK